MTAAAFFFLTTIGTTTAAASAARRPPTVVAVPSIGKPPKVSAMSLRTATEFVSMFRPTARTALENVGFSADMSPFVTDAVT